MHHLENDTIYRIHFSELNTEGKLYFDFHVGNTWAPLEYMLEAFANHCIEKGYKNVWVSDIKEL